MSYHYIVCGADSAGCVIASRLSENPAVRVLLIEAGRDNTDSKFHSLDSYYSALRGHDWGYQATPAAELNGRRFCMPMGKAVGGGMAINNMFWARGYNKDFEAWAEAAGGGGLGGGVLATYRKLENWQGPRRALRCRRTPGKSRPASRARTAAAGCTWCATVAIPASRSRPDS